jgi:cytoskeletal protein CcmA (bactofilin family)
VRSHWQLSPPGRAGQSAGMSSAEVGQESLAHLLAASLAALLTAIALLLATPRTAAAFDLRTSDTIDVPPGETVQDDLYALGQTVRVEGIVNGDLIAGAAETTVSGVVTGDLIAAAGTIVITGRVDGSVRATGGTIRIEGTVGEDLIVGGGDVGIGGSGRVGRDALLGVGTTTINGQVGRNVLAGAGQITVDGTVGGNLQAQVDTLTLGPGAVVGGALAYTSQRPAEISSSATVRGPVEYQATEQPVERDPLLDATIGWLRTMVGLSVLGLLLVLFAPGLSDRATEAVRRSPLASFGLGIALLVAWPIVALLVFGIGLAVGGWWLGLLLLALYVLVLLLGYVVAGLLVGRLTLAWAGQLPAERLLAVILGLAILTLAGLIPIVGWLVTLVAVLVGLGALGLAIAGSYHEPRQPAVPMAASPTAEPPSPVAASPATSR